jgi:hypothetical protein
MVGTRSRKLGANWQLAARIADLATIWQTLLIIIAPGAAFINALVTGSTAAWKLAAVLTFMGGNASGALILHPYLSSRIMRRQSDLDISETAISARFEGTSRIPQDWRTRRTIRALIPGVESFELILRYGDITPRLKISPTSGIRMVGPWETRAHGMCSTLLTFPKALNVGEPHTFEYSIIVPPDAEPCPPRMTISPQHPTGKTSLRVVFDRDDRPMSIWKKYWLSSIATASCNQNVLECDTNNVVEVEYRRLKPGHKYGFEWQWVEAVTPPAST